MKGKVCLITGATAGIGLVAARRLGAMGAVLALVARDRRKGETVLAGLRGQVPGLVATLFHADLSSLGEQRRVASEIAHAHPRLDVLIDNAGAIFMQREVTADGLERTFALNHMGYFLMTRLLLDRLKAAAPSRIVVVASDAHRRGVIDFDNLQGERRYQGRQAYANSKLANILFTRELARRLAGTGVTANCLHPGFVATSFGDNNALPYRLALGLAKRVMAIAPEQGADTMVHLASAPELAQTTGEYFARCRPETPIPAALDDDAARRLWEESERLAGAVAPL